MRILLLIGIYGLVATAVWFMSSALIQPKDQGPHNYKIDRSQTVGFSKKQFEVQQDQINKVWDRIESKVREVAPKSFKLLSEPATLGQIEALELRLGSRITPYLRASLLRHNGTGNWFGVFDFCSIDEIHSIYQKRALAMIEESDYWLELEIGDGTWVPNAITAGEAHFNLIVKLEDGEVLIQDPLNYSGPHSENFLEALKYMAKALETGNFETYDKGDERMFGLTGWGCPHY